MAKKIAIIFGINGQDGKYLSDLLESHSVEVCGVSRHGDNAIHGDVGDYEFVSKLIKEKMPDYVFHFAANSSTSHHALFDNHNAISTGTVNILEAVRLNWPTSKVFLSGSAMQFKNEGLPINESTPFEASSPYSAARIHSTYLARYYRSKFELQVYVGYFFNHDSPRRSLHHLNKKITDAVKRIAKGSVEKIEIGDLEAKKEFNFAGDMMEAIWLLVSQNEIFEAVIGSGKAYSIKDFLELCFQSIHKNWEDYITTNPHFVSEYKVLVSDPKILSSLGWKPKVNFEKLVQLMMESES